MLDSPSVVRLFHNVIDNDIKQYQISLKAIKTAIECMAHVYKPDTVTLNSQRSMIADYTDAAHRCAYLHKYAAFHTVMVRDMVHAAIRDHFDFFYRLVHSDEPFKICSLGGGPGSDVIGALAALHGMLSYFPVSATVIDYMFDWSYSFDSILKELGSGLYGAFGNNTSYYLNWRYVGANLLKTFMPEVNEALSSASLVTMIKFASATKCQDTKTMIKNIFAAMKPGAALLYIDNDGGGFNHCVMEAANKFNFIPIFGPLRRENYVNEFTRVRRFDYTSCFKSTVTVCVLLKPIELVPYGDPELSMNRQVVISNPKMRSPLLRSPLTPMLYHGSEVSQSPHFVPSRIATPLTQNILNSPFPAGYRRSPIGTPDTVPRHKRGCLPFRISNFRHHVSKRVNQFKAKARVMFKKRDRKNTGHPIFRL